MILSTDPKLAIPKKEPYGYVKVLLDRICEMQTLITHQKVTLQNLQNQNTFLKDKIAELSPLTEDNSND